MSSKLSVSAMYAVGSCFIIVIFLSRSFLYQILFWK